MLQWVIKMNEIINIKDYLKENFDKKTEIIEIKNKNIPIYLKQKYSFTKQGYVIRLLITYLKR